MNWPIAQTSDSMRASRRLSASRASRASSACRSATLSKRRRVSVASASTLRAMLSVLVARSASCTWVSRHRALYSSRSFLRFSAMPAVRCSMRSKRSSMVNAWFLTFEFSSPILGLSLLFCASDKIYYVNLCQKDDQDTGSDTIELPRSPVSGGNSREDSSLASHRSGGAGILLAGNSHYLNLPERRPDPHGDRRRRAGRHFDRGH